MKKLILLSLFLIQICVSIAQINTGNRKPFSADELNLKVGDTRVYYMLFEFNKCDFYPEFSDTLDLIVKFLSKRTDVVADIIVHADTRASEQCCQNLSQCRANGIETYLISKGISPSQIIAMGVQGKQPLIPESIIDAEPNEETKERYHQINRRVEVKIRSTRDDPRMPVDKRKKFDIYNTKKDGNTALSVGDVYVLDVLFTFNGGGQFYPEYTDTIQRLTEFLLAHPTIQVEISCHVDSRGSAEANRKLSEVRIRHIADYLILAGVPQKQFITVGKGEDEPLISEEIINAEPNINLRELYHKMNRRLEIKIIDVNLK